MSESTAETRETVYTDLVIEKDMKGKQFRSHSVFDRTTLSLKRLREMKTTWENEESDQRKVLAKMLENLKELIKEKEENESKARRARRLSALDTSEMSRIVSTINSHNVLPLSICLSVYLSVYLSQFWGL